MRRIITFTSLALAITLAASSSFAHQWPWSCNQENTYGWHLMTPEERKEHQAKLAGFTEYKVCREYIDLHQKKMEERAKDEAVTLPVIDINPCDEMKSRGTLK